MTDSLYHPIGLPPKILDRLQHHHDHVFETDMQQLLATVRAHLDVIRAARESNPFINTRLAEALADRMHLVAAHWGRIPQLAQPWLKAAMAYFADTLDELPDFGSPIGLEDDCDALNACLRYAGREDLCLSPEDFDEY